MRWAPSVIVLLCASVGHAQPDPRAAQLFEEGRELAKQGNWRDACEKFGASFELDKAVGTQLNLADCLEHRGTLARAWELFDAASRADSAGFPARAQMARGRADTLLARLSTVMVKLADPSSAGLVVTIGGATVPAKAVITLHVDPGPIEITVSAPGKKPFARTVTGTAGAMVEVPVPAAEDVVAAPPPSPPETSPAGGRRRGRVVLSLAVGGAGVAAFAIGEALAFSARGKYNDEIHAGHCTEMGATLTCSADAAKRIDDANHSATIATGIVIAGGALIATGAILFLTAPHGNETTIAPVATPTSVGLALSGRF